MGGRHGWLQVGLPHAPSAGGSLILTRVQGEEQTRLTHMLDTRAAQKNAISTSQENAPLYVFLENILFPLY